MIFLPNELHTQILMLTSRPKTVSTSDSAQKQLVAYVTIRPGSKLRAEELKAFVAAKLPRHLVPARIEIVESMPLLPNGKVDRRAIGKLGAVANSKTKDVEAADANLTPIQKSLVEIWSTVLSAENIEISDDFFDIGGHSLNATRTIAVINDTLGVKLSVVDLFDFPILSDLADQIEKIV